MSETKMLSSWHCYKANRVGMGKKDLGWFYFVIRAKTFKVSLKTLSLWEPYTDESIDIHFDLNLSISTSEKIHTKHL
jgi:hypothetical protein